MEEQNYAKHRRYVPGFHILLALLIIIVFFLAVINMVKCSACCQGGCNWLYAGLMPLLVSIILMLMFWYIRQFPLAVQDRVIRTEENLRHYILTGKQLDPRLTNAQIISLRFAPDEEYLELVKQAIDRNMAPDDIKKAIKNWKADHHRA